MGCGAALHRRTRSIEAEEASGAHGGAFGWLARVAELRFSGCGGGGARRVSVADAAVSERKRESCRAHASRSRRGPWWRPGQGECGRRTGHRPPTMVSRIAHTQRSRCTIAAWNQRVDCVRPSLTLSTFYAVRSGYLELGGVCWSARGVRVHMRAVFGLCVAASRAVLCEFVCEGVRQPAKLLLSHFRHGEIISLRRV